MKRAESDADVDVRSEAIRSLILIAPGNVKLRSIIQKELIVNSGSRPRRLQGRAPHRRRAWALQQIGKLGKHGEWSVPMILEILTFSGKSLDDYYSAELFELSAETLGKLGFDTPAITRSLQAYSKGQGLRSGNTGTIEAAMVSADTALKSIRQKSENRRAKQLHDRKPVEKVDNGIRSRCNKF